MSNKIPKLSIQFDLKMTKDLDSFYFFSSRFSHNE